MMRIFFVSMLISLSAMSCIKINETFVSPGRVPIADYHVRCQPFHELCNSINGTQNIKVEVIGHGSSSWRYYPMGINKDGVVYGNGFKSKATPAMDIKDLIKISNSIDPTMSIELDAHYPPKDHLIRKIYPNDGAYVMHDIPEWDKNKVNNKNALSYLHANTLKGILEYFVEEGFYKKSKVYVEIKVDKIHYEDNGKQELEEWCNALASELKTFAGHYQRDDQENWLCITSFSTEALDMFYKSLKDSTIQSQFDYVLIAGYKGGIFKSFFANMKGYVPKYNDSIQNFIVDTEWLDCVWFSEQGLNDFDAIFTKIVEERDKKYPSIKPVEFSFSNYQYKEEKMLKKLSKATPKKYKIRSFMVDIDY
ncbi:hypothetical protein [Flammeovirga sp. EKP202]|uniref:hypothetical protein n=1 Tax=Flammeovirga sp. EKP202 TaxID=2770592 RepID=UPI00165FF3B9|nr:hypothetical protein [Flammeovirga sp. EKP202]MBD0404402.1 hypothetical protein [Flammeovirga sp. EKP202]